MKLIRTLSALAAIACCGFTLAQDDFPTPVNTQAAGEHPPSPQEMLALFELPPGFKVTLFAGEPDVQQPICFDFDDTGRLWVAENYTYSAHGKIDPNLRDRVIILHDKDGDGQHDERKVFWDKGSMLTSLTWGYGGLWILNDGTLSFIPDKNGDDIPDSEPVEMLNGWTKNAGHNFVNGLMWGPDGGLYGRHGITDTSYPGTPDTPQAERPPINCGIWRFHPIKHTFEVVCHGTTNPWGLDYNEVGDMFMSNNVIGHLWHVIPGAHYERMFGQDFNPHCYELMGPISDHYHWDNTGKWSESRDGKADDLGGGHSHCGLMLYYGQNFPKEYWGKAFMCNTHGRCVNVDRIERKGSSYVAKHEPNFLKVNTPWFRGVQLAYGPAGCMYLSDWSDNGECHDHDGVHRTSGRIYRISYGEVQVEQDETVTSAITSGTPTDDFILNGFGLPAWHRRKIIRRLSEQALTDGPSSFQLSSSLITAILADDAVPERIHTLAFAIHHLMTIAPKCVDHRIAARFLSHDDAAVRCIGIKMIAENRASFEGSGELLELLATHESAPEVQLSLASAMCRLLPSKDSELAIILGSKLSRQLAKEQEQDNVLRLMLWYGVEPHWRQFGLSDQWTQFEYVGLLRQFVRRAAENWDQNYKDWWFVLKMRGLKARGPKLEQTASLKQSTRDILWGLCDALTARSRLEGPPDWPETASNLRQLGDPGINQALTKLGVLFGDGMEFEQLLKIIVNRNGDHAARSTAVQSLSLTQKPDLVPLFLSLLNDRAVYVDICKALAAFDDDPRIPAELLKRWDSLRHGAKEAAMDTMISRKSYAIELMKALNDGRVSGNELAAVQVRQLLAFNDADIKRIVEAKWGVINESSADKEAKISELKQKLTPDVLAAANLESGAALFKKSCAACHKLYGEGGQIGPDLTGGNRANMDYLLGNIVDPSAEVPRQFTVSIIALASGRVITGVVVGETNDVLTIQTDKEKMSIATADIEERTRTPKSLMPDGLLDTLTEEQIRDLLAFVMKRR